MNPIGNSLAPFQRRRPISWQQATTVFAVLLLVVLAVFFLRWEWVPSYAGLFAQGLYCTILLLAVSCVAGFALAVPIALAIASGPFLVSAPAKAFCSVIRGTPFLIQLWLLYYGLGSLFPLFPELRTTVLWPYLREAMPYAIIALTINFAGYEAEVMRGAFTGVERGQLEAARAFGMNRRTAFRRIWFPLAFYRALPTLTGETVLQLKSTPLVATISVLDVFAASSRVRQETYLTYEPLLVVASVYVCITGAIVFMSRKLESRLPTRIG